MRLKVLSYAVWGLQFTVNGLRDIQEHEKMSWLPVGKGLYCKGKVMVGREKQSSSQTNSFEGKSFIQAKAKGGRNA